MTFRRNGLNALSLSLLAIASLMAFAAANAEANWLVNGVALTTDEAVSFSPHTTIKLAVPAKNIEFRCNAVASEGMKLLASSAKAEGKVKFSGCSAFQISTGTEQKNCKPKEPIVAGGSLSIILHNSQNYILLSAFFGKPLATIEVSELCALTETAEVRGSTVLECLTPALAHEDCNTSEVIHLLKAAPAELFFMTDQISFGISPATFSGIQAARLSGAHTGDPWAGHV